GFGAGGETRTLMRSEPRQILSLVRIPISLLRQSPRGGHIRVARADRSNANPSNEGIFHGFCLIKLCLPMAWQRCTMAKPVKTGRLFPRPPSQSRSDQATKVQEFS